MNKALTGIAALATVAVALVAFVKYEDWVTIPRAREPVAALMKDPASAQFRNDQMTPAGWLCGEVNAKNSMGGYTGFKKFMSHGAAANYIEGDGVLGESSTADFIAIKDAQIAMLKQFARWRDEGVDVPRYSSSEQERMARERFFDAKWKATCQDVATL